MQEDPREALIQSYLDRIEELERENAHLKEQCESPFMDGYEMAKLEYRPRLIAAEDALDNARREALEEAETVIEDYEIGGRGAHEVRRDLAAAIRARKEKE